MVNHIKQALYLLKPYCRLFPFPWHICFTWYTAHIFYENELGYIFVSATIRIISDIMQIVMALATMESVRRVNVPMYATVRRTTVVFTMIVEYLLTRQKYTRHVVGR